MVGLLRSDEPESAHRVVSRAKKATALLGSPFLAQDPNLAMEPRQILVPDGRQPWLLPCVNLCLLHPPTNHRFRQIQIPTDLADALAG
jgi:hypothetical protein